MEYRTSLKKRLALNDKDTFTISTLRYLGLKYIVGEQLTNIGNFVCNLLAKIDLAVHFLGLCLQLNKVHLKPKNHI